MSAIQTAMQMKKKLEKSAIKFYYGSEIEKKIADATSTKPWGASGTELQEIADATNDYSQFALIMRAIWGRLSDPTNTWRQVYKTLTLIDSLIRNGNDRVVEDARHHIYEIRQLTDYRCIEDGQDQGVNVREKARAVADLLNDEDRIRDERDKAKKNRGKFRTAVSSDGSGGPSQNYGGYGRDAYDDPPRSDRSDRDRDFSRGDRDRERDRDFGRGDRDRDYDRPRRRSRSRSRSRTPPRRVSRSPPREREAPLPPSRGSRRDQSPLRGPIAPVQPAQQNLIGDLFSNPAPAPVLQQNSNNFFGSSSGGDDFFNPRAASTPAPVPVPAPQTNGGFADFGAFTSAPAPAPAPSNGGFGGFDGFQSFNTPAPAPAQAPASSILGFDDFVSAPAPVHASPAKPAVAAPAQQPAPAQKKPTMFDDVSSLVSLDRLSVKETGPSFATTPVVTNTIAPSVPSHGPARKPSTQSAPVPAPMGMGMGMGGIGMGGMGGMGGVPMGMGGNMGMGGMPMGMGGMGGMGMGGNMGMGGMPMGGMPMGGMGMGGNMGGMQMGGMGMGGNMGMGMGGMGVPPQNRMGGF